MHFRITAIAAALALGSVTAVHAQQQKGDQQTQAQSQSQSKSGQSASAQDKQQQKGIVSVSGKVIGSTQIKSTAGDMHNVVKVQTGKSKDQNAVVDLGAKAPTVDQGDRIFVSGYSARINGKPVIFARYVGKLEEVATNDPGSASAGGSSASGGASIRDDWTQDQYGLYQDNLAWTADNSGFTDFYGDADGAWGSYYDDVGDEGWLDV